MSPVEEIKIQDIIELPYIRTIIDQIPLYYPGPIVNRSDLIKPSSTKDVDIKLADEIDCDRLVAVKSKPTSKGTGKEAYSLNELKKFAERAGLKKSKKKADLVAALRLRYCK